MEDVLCPFQQVKQLVSQLAQEPVSLLRQISRLPSGLVMVILKVVKPPLSPDIKLCRLSKQCL